MSELVGLAIEGLRQAGVVLEHGLSESELERVEKRYGFEFCSDHREFLSAALPLGRSWVDWRHGSPDEIQDRLGWPVEGVLFDVENYMFWPRAWGGRPSDPAVARHLAESRLTDVPRRLVPVFSHRYLPAGPFDQHGPVLSVYQTDVIYYGTDLLDYVAQEFHLPPPSDAEPLRIPFWSDLVDGVETTFWAAR